MKTRKEKIREALSDVMPKLNQTIIAAHNCGVKEREISIAITNLEQAELWLERLINSTPDEY